MSEHISNNKRIAKNTMMLYIRMLLSVAVSLYTSRVVLNTIGVEDYGIYGVVGGVVAMFSFLNSSMSGATSRFLTFEMGQGNEQRLRDTFSSALIIHICIALIVFILAETVGLWFLYNKLVIPEGRIVAAHWVYQCSIISAMLTITQVPYNSLIIAHERMGVYAYIEILNVVLKLLIVYLLSVIVYDKLILYAVLVLFVSVVIMLIYRIYCRSNFKESRFYFILNKEVLKPMLSFTGWDFYGNMCVTARIQGSNFLINNFFGVIANASSSITTTVNGVMGGFAANIITAFRPRIIKYYSQQNWSEMQNMMNNAIKFSSLFLSMISMPFLFETTFIINLWLGHVPEYVVSFIRLTLISNCIAIINSVVVIGIHATGNIKRISIFTGSLFLLTVPISYLFLKLGFNADSVYIVNLVSQILIVSLNLWILNKQISSISIISIIKIISLTILVSVLSAILIFLLIQNIQIGFSRLLVVIFSDLILMTIFTYSIALTTNQRCYVKSYIKKILPIKQ